MEDLLRFYRTNVRHGIRSPIRNSAFNHLSAGAGDGSQLHGPLWIVRHGTIAAFCDSCGNGNNLLMCSVRRNDTK